MIDMLGTGVGGLTTAHTLIHRGVIKPSNIKIFDRTSQLQVIHPRTRSLSY